MQTWLKYCKELNRTNPVVLPEWRYETQYVNPYLLVDALSEVCTSEDVIAPGMSSIAPCVTWQAWRVKQGQRFTYAGALGAMGTGVPAAVGAALATGRRVICMVGDGGFMLNMQELEVVHRLNLNIKFFVLNNHGYGAITATQRAYFDGNYVGSNEASGLTLPRIDLVADAFKIQYDYMRNNIDMGMALNLALGFDGPDICEVMIPPEFELAWRVKRRMVDGQATSGDFGSVA